MTQHDELLARLDSVSSPGYDLFGLAATTIRDLSAKLEAERGAHQDMRQFHDACIKELYSMLGVDGSDGEYRFKWAALELAGKLDELKAERKAREEAERESAQSELLRFDENRRCCVEMGKRLAAESHIATVFERTRERCASLCVGVHYADGNTIAGYIRALQPEGEESAAPVQAHSKSQYKRLVVQGAIKPAATQDGQTPPLTAAVTSAASQETTAVGLASAAALQPTLANSGPPNPPVKSTPAADLIPGLERAAEICEYAPSDDGPRIARAIRAEIERLRNSDNWQAGKEG